ncbi:hypothetical protein G7054_g7119 [Neopestalotiopsis clavispora]|jgi:2-acylglycerol O-acyltransferase 2|nr:diacylglycerol O-acyltransferase 1 [Neopestalotiopsis sp. 37M]KAF7533388.1 hypothetical protein G7054_g7119 [Neopestalotiopsis clavispora]
MAGIEEPKDGSKESSFVHLSDAPTTLQLKDAKTGDTTDNGTKTNGTKTLAQKKGSKKNKKKLSDDQPASKVQDGVSFAEALKEDDVEPKPNDEKASESEEKPQSTKKPVEEKSEEKPEKKVNGQRRLDTAGHITSTSNGHGREKQSRRDESEDRRYRSDDSYPELDEMTINEIHTHQPPRQHEPYAKIRWAPFNVPAERRLQTMAVLMHCLCIGALVSVFFALCANPFAWPLLLVYLMHLLTSTAATDGSLKYRSEWFRSSYIWDLFAGYFPARLHKTHDLPPTRKYIFGYHPHGIISHGAWAAFATEALGFAEKFPGITNSLLTLDSNFRIPFYRDYVLAMGVRSVSKDSIANILTRGGKNNEGMGRAVTIVIGGARESLEAQPGQMRLILKERKGFIKLAVRTGADLVPVLAFGENEIYDQLRPKEHPLVHKIQMFVLKVWKFTLPFLHGRGIFNYDVGLMPYRHPLNIVVGAPIKVQQYKRIDDQEIDRLHELYVEELMKLWDRYKDEFLPDRKEELEIL